MDIAYARSPLRKSIFLAGPTPRSADVLSWRPGALAILERVLGFKGTVFVPENGDGSRQFSYDNQIEWELQALHSATVVVFWVPRELATMPGLTTNVEFGLFAARRNVVLGYPTDAAKMKYLNGIATMYGLQVFPTMYHTLEAAVKLCDRPFITSKEQA